MAADFGDDIMERILGGVKRALKMTPEELKQILEWLDKVSQGFSKAELEGDLAKMNFDSPETAQKVKEIADKMGIEVEVVNSSVVCKTEDFEKLSNKVDELKQKATEITEQNQSQEHLQDKDIQDKSVGTVVRSENYLKSEDSLSRLYGSSKQFDKNNRVSLDDEIKDAQAASKELAGQTKTQVHEKVIEVGEVVR